MAFYGWKVIDDVFVDGERVLHKELPCCVYQDQTTDTVNTIKSLINSGAVRPEFICGLLDSGDGMDEMHELSEDVGLPISYVCSAKIYDDLFKFVRC